MLAKNVGHLVRPDLNYLFWGIGIWQDVIEFKTRKKLDYASSTPTLIMYSLSMHDYTEIVIVFKISLKHFFQLISNTFDWQPVAWWLPVSVCSSSRWSGTSGRTWGCPVCLGRCLPWVGMLWTSCPLNCSPPMSGRETLPPLTWLYYLLHHHWRVYMTFHWILKCWIFENSPIYC